jgi:hypothetical protein
MATDCDPLADLDLPRIYQIRIKGHLGKQWADWFSGLSITLAANGETVLSGLISDQAALHGVLRKIRDLGMTLLAVTCENSAPSETPLVETTKPTETIKDVL